MAGGILGGKRLNIMVHFNPGCLHLGPGVARVLGNRDGLASKSRRTLFPRNLQLSTCVSILNASLHTALHYSVCKRLILHSQIKMN